MSTRLNLLPWRELRRKEQDRQLLTIAAGAWVLMGLIVFYAHLHMNALISDQNTRNKFLQGAIVDLNKQIVQIQDLKKEREALIARMKIIYQLQGDRTEIVHILDELVRRTPQGVYLTSLQQQGKVMTLTGVAQSNARVSALMRNLAASDWFNDPELDVINVKQQGGDRVSDFTLKVGAGPKTPPAGAKKPLKPGAKT